MRSSLLLLAALTLACGPTEAPAASSATPPSPPPAPTVEPAPPAEPPAPPPAPAALPDDFAMRTGGGPVMAGMAAGMTINHSEIRPGATAGTFDVVVLAVVHDEMGMPGEGTEVRRTTAPRERVEAIYQYVTTNLAALSAPCFDPSIMDGAVARLEVTYAGQAHTFSCVNARTPEFSQLESLYQAVVTETAPTP